MWLIIIKKTLNCNVYLHIFKFSSISVMISLTLDLKKRLKEKGRTGEFVQKKTGKSCKLSKEDTVQEVPSQTRPLAKSPRAHLHVVEMLRFIFLT